MVVLSKRTIAAGARIRVLVVDDSEVTRRVISDMLSRDPLIEVVGGAHNGIVALERIAQLKPDLITLDVTMPELDGIETLRRIRREDRNLMVVMVSALTNRGAAITLDALTLGANDYVLKPQSAAPGTEALQNLREELVNKVKQFFTFTDQPLTGGLSRKARPSSRTCPTEPPKAVVIGVSTGGPTALADLIPQLPQSFPLPILVVQHMPPMFTKVLADRLAASSSLRVQEATEGATIEPGKVLIAPGNYHMAVTGHPGSQCVVRLNQDPQENSCRPAACRTSR